DKRSQHLLDRELAVVAWEIGSIAPIVTAAEEENLHAAMAASLVRRDDVRVGKTGNVDVLVALNQRQRADAVADQCRGLEVERPGGLVHLGRKPLLNVAA